jgi:hypothetical protein
LAGAAFEAMNADRPAIKMSATPTNANRRRWNAARKMIIQLLPVISLRRKLIRVDLFAEISTAARSFTGFRHSHSLFDGTSTGGVPAAKVPLVIHSGAPPLDLRAPPFVPESSTQ